MRTRITSILITLLLTIGLASTGFAAQSATDFVRAKSDQIIQIVNTSKTRDQRLNTLRKAVHETLNYKLLSRRTLGLHWKSLSEKQHTEFVNALRDLLETSYVSKLGDDTIEPGSYFVRFTGEKERHGRYTVSGIVKSGGDSYHVDIRLKKDGSNWEIFDIVTDDVSLVESYAESFDQIIREHGFDELMKRIKDNTQELKKEMAGK